VYWRDLVAVVGLVLIALVWVAILVHESALPNAHLPALDGVPSPGAGAVPTPSVADGALPAPSATLASPAPGTQAGRPQGTKFGPGEFPGDVEDEPAASSDVEDEPEASSGSAAAPVPGSGVLNPALALTAPSLGGAAPFAVLGGAGVTCTASTVTGNVGSKLTVTQTPTCNTSEAIHQGDATAVGAFSAFLTAYRALTARPCGTNLTGQALGGKTLAPGVYCFNSTADLTSGTLMLAGPSSGVWVFRVGTAITTGTAHVVMAGGASACNVYWVLGTAATIGTGTTFQGNILAGSAISFTGANSRLVGRALAQTAVTMTGTTISGC
jgi:hypothetical protein